MTTPDDHRHIELDRIIDVLDGPLVNGLDGAVRRQAELGMRWQLEHLTGEVGELRSEFKRGVKLRFPWDRILIAFISAAGGVVAALWSSA